jgi:hypothetical protein
VRKPAVNPTTSAAATATMINIGTSRTVGGDGGRCPDWAVATGSGADVFHLAVREKFRCSDVGTESSVSSDEAGVIGGERHSMTAAILG